MDTQSVAQRFEVISPFLDERMRRLFASNEARALGHGGVTAVAEATGVSRRAISCLNHGPVLAAAGICPPPTG